MYYIVFDLELNQDFSSIKRKDIPSAPFEIIQIGAVKLDQHFNTCGTFNRFVKPVFYKEINPFVTGLTGITTEQLQCEEEFPEVFRSFIDFIGDTDQVFCVWGSSDMKELFRNVEKQLLSNKQLPRKYINLQPYVSLYFNYSQKNPLRLQHAVEALKLPAGLTFHDAFNDAVYTAEIFKKIYNSFMQPKIYDPSSPAVKPRQPRKEIDTAGLINQFEKMYQRKMSDEEKSIIQLAYKMGKTHQFLK